MEKFDILIVDDDENLNYAIAQTLKKRDFSCDQAFSFLEAKEKINFFSYPLVITDVRMPDGNGLELISEIKSRSPQTSIIVCTAYATVEDAIKALKLGAGDYLQKPFSPEQLIKTVETYFPRKFSTAGNFKFLTINKQIQELLKRAELAAQSNAAILIFGESGSGKELLARYIHQRSRRAAAPYLAINCAAIPENLLESELFGYERGAFTGAEKTKPGKFELADGGTLVLDEIGDMSLHLQAKILRVIQEKEVERLGGRKSIPFDTRIIALTNQNLQQKINAGKFRQDLFFRLSVVQFSIPPLRERLDDISYLANYFINYYRNEVNKPELKLSAQAEKRLLDYDWPGNVRQLQNVIYRTVIFSGPESITPEDIEIDQFIPAEGTTRPTSLSAMEKEMILITLKKTGGNKAQAAEILGISTRTLRNKLKEYGFQEEQTGDVQN